MSVAIPAVLSGFWHKDGLGPLEVNPSRPKAFLDLKTSLLSKCYKSKCKQGMKISTVQSYSVHVLDGLKNKDFICLGHVCIHWLFKILTI